MKSLSPFLKVSFYYLFIGFLTRLILILSPITGNDISILDIIKIFFIGFLNDFCVSIIICSALYIHLVFLTNSKFTSPYKYLILLAYIIIFIILFFYPIDWNEYEAILPLMKGFVIIKFLSYILLLSFPSIKTFWRYYIYCFIIFLYIFLISFNGINEYLFWNEFGVRYNFIAIDYFLYSNEVIKNIINNHSVIPAISILTLISIIITIFFVKNSDKILEQHSSYKLKLTFILLYALMFSSSVFLLNTIQKTENNDNPDVNELQANGLVKIYNASNDNFISYERFYNKIPENQAVQIINKEYNTQGIKNIKIITDSLIPDSLREHKRNIVLITIENLNAYHLSTFGNKENLTPNLDHLGKNGILFTNLYAIGKRTSKGLEALTLSLPPQPGESIIKRQNNNNLYSIGSVLKNKGYDLQFLYGGTGSEANRIISFFRGNNYQIIDKKSFTAEEITNTKNKEISDYDLFKKAIKVFNLNAREKKPFFAHIMTTNNDYSSIMHPDGDTPSNENDKFSSIKYTDHMIGNFINKAKEFNWFNNTVFIFIAGHGTFTNKKTDISLSDYHIPAIIYAPGFTQPQQVSKLSSQIDIMPTVLGLLKLSYTSRFYGQDILNPNYKPRAFIATYQDLGYLKNNILTILSPKEKIEQYNIFGKTNHSKLEVINKELANEAIANYQTSSYLLKNKLLNLEN